MTRVSLGCNGCRDSLCCSRQALITVSRCVRPWHYHLTDTWADIHAQQWLCDSPTALPRLLKLRSGHSAPPTCIRYYGDDGKQILTAGRDRALRYTSVVRDSRSFELSQGISSFRHVDAMLIASYPRLARQESDWSRSFCGSLKVSSDHGYIKRVNTLERLGRRRDGSRERYNCAHVAGTGEAFGPLDVRG